MKLVSLPVLLFALVAFALAWAPSLLGSAGYFGDELYFLACADRLDLGYVDHPPLSILILWVVRAVAGDSLPVLHLVPSLMAAATVLVTGRLALRLGAGGFGQALAAAAVVAAPVYQTIFGYYSMNALSLPIWAGCFLILVEIERRDEPRLWVAFGLLAGVGLENKHTLALLAVGLAVGMLLSPARRHLAGRWLWIGLAAALLLALPNLLWQVSHGWPSLEFYVGQDRKNIPTPPLRALWGQVLAMNPLSLPVWLAGLVFFLGPARGRAYRHLGVAYVLLLALMVVGGKSRADRIAPAYIALFASGGVVLGDVLARAGWRWLRPALLGAVLLGGAALTPATAPWLSPELTARYLASIGIVPKIERSDGEARLPLWLANRYEWEHLVDDVAAAVASLQPSERARSAILVPDYSRAAALEVLGAERELPAVYSGHNSYFLWGPPKRAPEVVIVVGFGEVRATGPVVDPGLSSFFEEVAVFRVHDCTWCSPWRDQAPIWIARHPRLPVAQAWPELRTFH